MKLGWQCWAGDGRGRKSKTILESLRAEAEIEVEVTGRSESKLNLQNKSIDKQNIFFFRQEKTYRNCICSPLVAASLSGLTTCLQPETTKETRSTCH